MQIRSLVRAATAAAILGLVAPTAARAQSFWDFVHMSGVGGDLGASKSYSLGSGYGTISASSSTNFDLYSKGFDHSLPYSEKGLGLCNAGSGDSDNNDGVSITYSYTPGCTYGRNSPNSGSSFEIGEIPNNTGGFLTLDFSLLTVALQSVRLSSLSSGFDFAEYYTKSSGSCASATGWSAGSSVTDNNSDGIFDLTNAAVTGAKCIKFASNSSNNHDYGDFLVQGVTTDVPGTGTGQSTVPEPASMTLLATGLAGMAAAARRRRNKK